jgi:hypothetical protein
MLVDITSAAVNKASARSVSSVFSDQKHWAAESDVHMAASNIPIALAIVIKLTFAWSSERPPYRIVETAMSVAPAACRCEILIAWLTFPGSVDLYGQELSQHLSNGNCETWEDDHSPNDWFLAAPNGGRVGRDAVERKSGEFAAVLDAYQADPAVDRPFTNLMQTVNAISWRGQKLRFRATELAHNAQAQLWFGVDREGLAENAPVVVDQQNGP